MRSKLYQGGGLAVCHSRPFESQGFGGAGLGSIQIDQTKLNANTMNDEPRMYADTEAKSFSVWRLCAYSKTLRGWSKSPTRNSGKNVRLKNTNIIQKWICPSRLFSIFPVNFGVQ